MLWHQSTSTTSAANELTEFRWIEHVFNALTILSILVVFFVISAHCKKETASIHVFKTFSKLLSQTVSNYSIFSEMVCKLFYDVNEENLMFVKKTTWISAWNGMSKVIFFSAKLMNGKRKRWKTVHFCKINFMHWWKTIFRFFLLFLVSCRLMAYFVKKQNVENSKAFYENWCYENRSLVCYQLIWPKLFHYAENT